MWGDQMAKFSDLRAQMRGAAPASKQPFDLKIIEALLLPAVFAAQADGSFADSEMREFAAICGDDLDLHAVRENIRAVVIMINARVENEDAEDLLVNAAALLEPEARGRAIVYALRIAMADGDFDAEERSTLLPLARKYGIDAQEFADIEAALTAKAQSREH